MKRSKLFIPVLSVLLLLAMPLLAQKPVVIEVVCPAANTQQDKLFSFCTQQQAVNKADIYQWKNHFVVYGDAYRPLYSKLKAAFKDCTVKLYDKPFYDFERSLCGDDQTSLQVTNIDLTANLVADAKMQQEYLNYHATQFKKWPEVSQGFCNAQFQHLLVFKNGRQLMLIISIPKGKTLDELNPLTTKDNPRVTDWNNIMKKYQEGIEGTAPGETWVFLKPYQPTNQINN